MEQLCYFLSHSGFGNDMKLEMILMFVKIWQIPFNFLSEQFSNEIAFRIKSGLWASHLLSFVLCNFMTFLSFKVSFWFFDFCDNSEFKFSKLYRKCKFYAILLFLVTKGFTAEKHEKRNKNRERICSFTLFQGCCIDLKRFKIKYLCM